MKKPEPKISNENRFVKFVGVCVNKLWLLLASVIILLAVIHLALGFLLPHIDNYRPEIINWVEKNYNIKMKVDKISADWSIDGPVLELTNFKLISQDSLSALEKKESLIVVSEPQNQLELTSQYNIIEIGNVSIYLDIIATIWNQRFSTQNIAIDNARLNFYVDRQLGVSFKKATPLDVSIKVAEPIDLERTSQTLFDILFAQKKISLTDSELSLHTLDGARFDYHVESLTVRKFDNIHQLSGDLKYDDGGKISLVTEVYGDPTLVDSYSEVYLEGDSIDLAKLPWLKRFAVSSPSSGELSWQLWGVWKNKRWQESNGIAKLSHVSWKKKFTNKTTEKVNSLPTASVEDGGRQESKKEIALPNNEVSFFFSWQHQSFTEGYLSLHHIDVKEGGAAALQHIVPFDSDIFVKFSRSAENYVSWSVAIENLRLERLAAYAGSILEDELALTRFLQQSNVKLSVDSINFSLNKKEHGTWGLSDINLSFSELEYLPWNNIPRMNGLFGRARIGKDSGEIELSAENIELEFPGLFRHSIVANELNGLLSWDFLDSTTPIFLVERFSLKNDDLTIYVKGKYFDQDGTPILSLYTELQEVNAGKKSRYLPTGIMTKNLVAYLDNSINSGRFSLIKSVVRGPSNGFPYANNEGLFVALGMLEDTHYKFLPDWPAVTGLNAKLLFEGNSMDIIANNAQSMGVDVLYARATTRDFSLKEPILNLSFETFSKNNEAKRLIENSPLKSISNSLKSIDYLGDMRTKINMRVGLAGKPGAIPEIQGDIKLYPKKSQITTPFISLDNLDGHVKFDHSGITASQLTAGYRGESLTIKLDGRAATASPVLSLDINGRLPENAIADFLGDKWSRYIVGKPTFTSLVQFSPQDNVETTRVFFQSDMKDVKVNFPGELGKAEGEISELFLKLDLSKRSVGNVKWQGVNGRWYWGADETKLLEENSFSNAPPENRIDYGGDFFINTEDNPEKIKPGIRASGNMTKVVVTEWITFINQLRGDIELEIDGATKSAKLNTISDELKRNLVFESIALNVKELDLDVVSVFNANLLISNKDNSPWLVTLDSLTAELSLQMNREKPWMANISKLDINIAETKADEDIIKSKNQDLLILDDGALSPLQLVDIDIFCKTCIVRQKDYGEVKLQIRKSQNGVSFSGKSKKVKQHELLLSGSWETTNELETRTRLFADLKANNVGQLLKLWDVEAAIKDSSGRLVADFSWGGSPWEFDYYSANGDMQLDLGKGYLSEISEGAGRLFSLFNLQSLVRKLTFDFKDVYKKGFFYDSIRGTLGMKDGVISSENISIRGNVADVKLYGQTDIKNEQIEQIAVITPHLTSSLPVLAAWAIEPTTGVIVFLINKIMEPAVEVATRIDYRIYGTFDDVIVKKLKTAKKKIKVEYESENEPKIELENTMDTKPKSESEIQSDKESQSGLGKPEASEIEIDEE
jgi:uncharacterized protein (TIGR02099 family)